MAILHSSSPLRAKKLWNVLKVTLILMARKGLISKRRFIMDIHFIIKRGKLFRKSVTNYFMFHFHSSSRDMARGSFSIQHDYYDYEEFSCTNTPITNPPVFSHMPKLHSYFPCINLPTKPNANPKPFILLPTTPCPNHTFDHYLHSNASTYTLSPGFGMGGTKSGSGSPPVSPFPVPTSNYSSDSEEAEENQSNSENGQVDSQAEEFIKGFYEQLKMQQRLQLLEYN